MIRSSLSSTGTIVAGDSLVLSRGRPKNGERAFGEGMGVKESQITDIIPVFSEAEIQQI